MALGVSPVNDYVFVQKTDEPLASGLVLAAPVDPTAPCHATVIAVGPGRHSEYSANLLPMLPCKAGDVLLIHGGAGTKFRSGTVEYIALLPRDVIGVVSA